MDNKKKNESQTKPQAGAFPNKKQEQQGRPTTERRQEEAPTRNDEQRQGQGDRFPRESFEGGKGNH